MTLLDEYRLKGYSANTTAIEVMSPAFEKLKKYAMNNRLIAMFLMNLKECILNDTDCTTVDWVLEANCGYRDKPFVGYMDNKPVTIDVRFLGYYLNIQAFITDDAGNIFERNAEIINALRDIDKVCCSLKPETDNTKEGTLEQTIAKIPPEMEKLFDIFKEFKDHYSWLKKEKFILPDGSWNKDKGGNNTLGYYFGYLQEKKIIGRHAGRNNMWADVERAFNTKNLKGYYSNINSVKKCKTKKWDNVLKILQNLIDGKIQVENR